MSDRDQLVGVLYEFGQVVLGNASPVSFLTGLASTAREVATADGAAVTRVGADGETTLAAVDGVPDAIVELLEEAVQEGSGPLVAACRAHYFEVQLTPLISGRDLYGAIVVLHHAPPGLDPRQERLLQGLAAMGAAVLSGAFQHEALERIAGERRRAEAAFDYQASLVANVSEAIVSTDLGHRIQSWNAAAEEIYGYSADDVLGMPLDAVLGSHLGRETAELAARTLRETGEWRGLLSQRRKDGSRIHVLSSMSYVRDRLGERSGIVAINTDVTEQKRLEEDYRQAQKMEAVGRVAAGVAHDFNNLLMGIIGCTDMALARLKEGDPARWPVEEIKRASIGAAATVRKLLTFSRRPGGEPQAAALDHVVAQAEAILRPLLGADVTLEIRLLAGADTYVPCGAAELEQVLMNLAVNARDAMPGGGRLEIVTSEDDDLVTLTVRDSGTGMDEETRARIFEPFFTTKPRDSGTGLGLASVFAIVTNAGGRIDVETAPGAGTSFHVRFPRVAAPARPETERPPALAAGEGETVLVVEDELLVRRSVAYYLESAGYRVLVANDADDALRTADRYGGVIALVLTDIVLPGMQGKELAHAIRARHPDVRVLFMSAHPPAQLRREGRLDAGATSLEKPFDRTALLAEVRAALAGVAARPAFDPGRVTLLIAEDHELARTASAELLREIGYTVLESANGAEAIELARDATIDVLITDIGLPDIDGVALARRIREAHPEARLLFVSGLDREDPRAHRALAEGRAAYLEKPIDVAELDRTLRQLLTSP